MEVEYREKFIELVQGDITRVGVDAVVNAANERLMGGGGVDGAIHRAGGPTVLAECERIGGCPTGEAVITTGGDLPARHVIHAVGPVWRGGKHGEQALLRNAYRASLGLARERGIASIAFPSISTGAYRYPIEEASRVAINAVLDALEGPSTLKRVVFVLFSDGDYAVYEEVLTGILSSRA
jgi:O-acetyl-ADP-ribose deacetylase (regulator of RNase III)